MFTLLFLELFGFSRISWLLIMALWDLTLLSTVLPLPLLSYFPKRSFQLHQQAVFTSLRLRRNGSAESAHDCICFLQHTALLPRTCPADLGPTLALLCLHFSGRTKRFAGPKGCPSWDPHPSPLGHVSGSQDPRIPWSDGSSHIQGDFSGTISPKQGPHCWAHTLRPRVAQRMLCGEV